MRRESLRLKEKKKNGGVRFDRMLKWERMTMVGIPIGGAFQDSLISLWAPLPVTPLKAGSTMKRRNDIVGITLASDECKVELLLLEIHEEKSILF